jgi:hypothetical protein
MSTLTKVKKVGGRARSKRVVSKATAGFKAPVGGLFAGREHLFGSLSFTPLKGEASKRVIRERIAADHNT